MVRVNKDGFAEQSKSGRYSLKHPRRKYNTIYEVVEDRSKNNGVLWVGHTQFVFDKEWVGKQVQLQFAPAPEVKLHFKEREDNGDV